MPSDEVISRAEFDALPEREFYAPPPPVGTVDRRRIPEDVRDRHGGRRWLLFRHLPPDALAPRVGDRWTSRLVLRYPEVVG